MNPLSRYCLTPEGSNCYTFFVSLILFTPTKKVFTLKKIGILYHPMVKATQKKAGELQEFLSSRGIHIWLCSAWEAEKARTLLNGTDLILTVGGDGTILRAAQVLVTGKTPITGINMGKLGFMTELNPDEAMEKIVDLLDGKGWIDERAMLQAELSGDGKEPQTFHALNDVVVGRGAIIRVVYIDVNINNQQFITYKTDALIMATATGSTGYSLAAGGPMMYPQSRDFLLVPVAPHLCSSYNMVLPSTAIVELRIDTVHEAVLCVDGHINLPLLSGDCITVRQSPCTTWFLRIHPETSFYSSFEQRLKGKSHDESS